MEKFKKYGGWGLGVIAVLLFGVVLAKAAVTGYLIHVDNWNGDVNVVDSASNPVNIGADDGTHITKLTVLETLDVSGAVVFSGALTVGGATNLNAAFTTATDTRIVSLVEIGSVVTLATSTVLTADQLCNAGVIIAQPGVSTIAPFEITLPNSSTLFADCLTTNGDSLSIPFVNQSSLTSTLFVVGTGGPASASSSLSVALRDSRMIQLFRTSSIGCVLNIR